MHLLYMCQFSDVCVCVRPVLTLSQTDTLTSVFATGSFQTYRVILYPEKETQWSVTEA